MAIKFDSFKSSTDRLMVVDALNLAFRYKHSKTPDFGSDYLRTVQSLAHSYKCGSVVIAADKGTSSYRKAIYPDYKQNRKDRFAAETEQEKQEFLNFLEDYNKTLDMLRAVYPVFQFDGVEADDIAGYIVLRGFNKFKLEHVQLISSDKDWDLLVVDDKVARFSYVTRKDINSANWSEHYDCPQEMYLTLKCLMGDAGDNVKGVKGLGPKRSAKIISDYGDIYDIIDSLPIPGTSQYIKDLNSSKDLLLKNIELMDLLTYCEQAIGEENIERIDDGLARLLRER